MNRKQRIELVNAIASEMFAVFYHNIDAPIARKGKIYQHAKRKAMLAANSYLRDEET